MIVPLSLLEVRSFLISLGISKSFIERNAKNKERIKIAINKVNILYKFLTL